MEGQARAAERLQERAVYVDEAKARKTSRYARAMKERAQPAERPQATGSRLRMNAADGQETWQDALVHEEERVTGASELEANFAGD